MFSGLASLWLVSVRWYQKLIIFEIRERRSLDNSLLLAGRLLLLFVAGLESVLAMKWVLDPYLNDDYLLLLRVYSSFFLVS